MVVPRSDSVSSFSTAGSSQFVDAQSKFTDAEPESGMQDQLTNSQVGNTIEDGIKVQNTANLGEEKGEINNIEKGVESKVANEENAIKTKQPAPVKEPRAFVSKEEKIRELREQNAEKGYHREESECHEYICSNNMLEVLDLPNWKGLLGSICVMCCNSCFTTSTSSVQKAAAK